MIRSMKQEQLKTLIAVIETGSFSRAANRVCKSQAAVSKTIKGLENELNVTLFSRNTYRPELTREGKALYRKVLEVMNQLEQLEAFAKELSLGIEPELNIAVSAICSLSTILTTIKHLTEKYPQTRINLSVNNLGRVLEQVRLGEADIAITPLEGTPPTFECDYLYDINMILVASHDFELANFPRCSVEQLKCYNQIVVKNEHHGDLDRSDDILQSGQRWDVNGLLIKKEIILAGLGWGQLPEYLISEELQERRLVALSVEDYTQQKNPKVYIVRKNQQKPGPVAQALWQAIHHSV